MYRDKNGQVRTDLLPSHWRGHTIEGIRISPGGALMASAVCTRGYCGGLAAASPDARTAIIWSRDGGVSWQELGEFDGVSYTLAVTPDGVVVGQPRNGEVQGLHMLPSGRALSLPAGADGSWPFVFVRRSGELVWQSGDGRYLLLADGERLADLGRTGRLYTDAVIEERPGGRFAVEWSEHPHVYLGVWNQAGTPERVFSQRFWGVARLGGWLSPTTLIGTPLSELVRNGPAIYDIERGVASSLPLNNYLPAHLTNARNRVMAVIPGPFVRVFGTGSCLNVRERPETSARVLDCAADSVLLRDLGETREEDGVIWLRVATPAGVQGWVSSYFVER